jgi:hypothetical protein
MSTSSLPAVLSALSLGTPLPPRVSVVASINCDTPGFKTFLFEFCTGEHLFASIHRLGPGMTSVTFQGHHSQFPRSLETLKTRLSKEWGEDVAIVWTPPTQVADKDRFTCITIQETLADLKRLPSSGEFLEKELDEISFGGSAAGEQFMAMTQALAQTGTDTYYSFARTTGLMKAPDEKIISLEYQDQTFKLEVSSLLTMTALIEAVNTKFGHPAIPLKSLYEIDNHGNIFPLTDIKEIQRDHLYYALNTNEELPKNQFSQEMEDFFLDLKENELVDAELSLIRKRFAVHMIKFGMLFGEEELAITDEKLEKFGITQGGLRIAILSAIQRRRERRGGWIQSIGEFFGWT